MLRLYDFYPRSPCGERPHFHLYTDLIVSNFYPRSPCGERLQGQCPPGKEPVISIHALLAESDVNGDAPLNCFVNFYPRSPCGERHYFSGVMRQNPGISIHALLAESDPWG